MAIRPFTADDALVGDGAHGRINHHHVNVIATSAAEVVRLAGGWLYDRARAGWQVNVVVDDCDDVRPLTILGATRIDADAESVLRATPRDGAVAVSAALVRADARIRRSVLDVRVAEVTILGAQWPAELGRLGECEAHRLSLAAQAFKMRALAAASIADDVGTTETLFELGDEAGRALYSV